MACKGKKWSLGVNDDDRCRLSTALDVGKKLPTDLPLPKGHVIRHVGLSSENCEVSFRFCFKAIK